MYQVRYSILSMHRRRYHIFGLVAISITVQIVQHFINSISLGEAIYSNEVFSSNIIELIGLIFVIYFGSSTRTYIKDSKIFYLFESKKESGENIIGGIILAISTIIIGYTILAYGTNIILGGLDSYKNHYIIQGMIGTSMVLFIMTIITVGFSLITSSYISAMISLIIYFLSYSINFIITSINQETNTNNISQKILSITNFFLPRFDLLKSEIPFFNRILAFLGHIIIGYILYKTILYYFSYNYKHHESILNIGHKTQSRKT